jgi:FlaA1/EpsC-like NDP-sugar epimerase
MIFEYEPLATGRTTSLLDADVDANRDTLAAALANRSVAVLGAAGSIGSAVVKNLLAFRPAHLALIDLSENNLAELVRDLRASSDVVLPRQFNALPIALGSPECVRFFSAARPFDYLFSLCAVKHVRSEKDVFSIMRMLDTNVLFLDDLLSALPRGRTRVFSVSTDKATNPASLMGASKLLMERVLAKHADHLSVCTARFANVAFSDGSLPFSFLKRIEKKQPIAAPTDVRRFFMSHQEAGQLCLLSGVLAANREAFFPKLEPGVHEKTFIEIATALLKRLGYEPYPCRSEDEAKAKTAELLPQRKWPCLFAPSDTSGEKDCEELCDDTDDVDWDRFKAVGVIRAAPGIADRAALNTFIDFAKAARGRNTSKAEYVDAMRTVIPTFQHVERDRSLDEKM